MIRTQIRRGTPIWSASTATNSWNLLPSTRVSESIISFMSRAQNNTVFSVDNTHSPPQQAYRGQVGGPGRKSISHHQGICILCSRKRVCSRWFNRERECFLMLVLCLHIYVCLHRWMCAVFVIWFLPHLYIVLLNSDIKFSQHLNLD